MRRVHVSDDFVISAAPVPFAGVQSRPKRVWRARHFYEWPFIFRIASGSG